MDDLISREAAKFQACNWSVKPDDVIYDGIKEAIKSQLDMAPAVDAAPVVHGRWEKSDTGLWQSCSECGVAVEVQSMYMCKASEDENFNFCPHCGARMDGERRDSE